MRQIESTLSANGMTLRFSAMASPCEVLLDSDDISLAQRLGQQIANEVWRIEDKYSRYRQDNLCWRMNHSMGKPVAIDQETYQLLSFAQQCYELSDGLFDLTSGVLRKVWRFDGSDKIPSKCEVAALMPTIGWSKVIFDQHFFTLPPEMELDFGGIGKEYAADKALQIALQITDEPVLINLGGDLVASKPRKNGEPWLVGIEHPGLEQQSNAIVSMSQGALATSGDAKRYLLKDNIRYSHILNAKTGWPIENAPRSVTVAAGRCIEAGLLATLAIMQGSNAKAFLDAQQVKYWLIS